MKLLVEGHIQTGSYDGKKGKVYTTDIICDNIEFCEKKKESVMSIPEGIDEEIPFT